LLNNDFLNESLVNFSPLKPYEHIARVVIFDVTDYHSENSIMANEIDNLQTKVSKFIKLLSLD